MDEFANITDDQLNQMITELESTLTAWNDTMNIAGPFESEWEAAAYLNRQDYAQEDLQRRLEQLKAERERRRAQVTAVVCWELPNGCKCRGEPLSMASAIANIEALKNQFPDHIYFLLTEKGAALWDNL